MSIIKYAPFADFEQFGNLLGDSACAGSTRVTDGDRPGIVVGYRPKHIDEFIFILRLHVNEVRYVPQIPDIEKSVMRWTIVSTQSGAIHAKRDVQVLERNVVNDHVVGSLHDGRVNRQKRL